MPDLSVTADDGAASDPFFAIVPVVSLSVRGRDMDALEVSDGVVAAGVAGREFCVLGVPTTPESSTGVPDSPVASFTEPTPVIEPIGAGISIRPGPALPAVWLKLVSFRDTGTPFGGP